MRGIALAAVILMAGWVASAAENEIDEKSLCPVAISVFDGKDSTQMRQFLRFVQNVFDELAARSRENGEPQLKTSLTDTSVEGFGDLGLLPPASDGDSLRCDIKCLSRLEVAPEACDR